MDIYRRSEHKSKLLNYSDLHLFGIEMTFIELREYYDIIEDGLAAESGKRINDYNARYDEVLASNKEEGWAARVDDQYASEIVKLDYYFPHAFRASFLIQLFSFLEFELKEICNHHHHTLRTDVSFSDFKGSSDLDRAKLYLTRIAKVEINDLQPEWTYLNEIRKIRNTLVHHQGIIIPDDKDRQQMLRFIEKQPGIAIKELPTNRKSELSKDDLTIMITAKTFNGHVLGQAESFFKKLLETGPVKLKP